MTKMVIGTIGATVVILIGMVLAAGRSSPAPQDELGESIAIQPAKHIPPGADHPAYNSNPPTSGWHYAQDASWGFHAETVADETAVHNLEHGGVWISYNPDKVDGAVIQQLTDLVRRYPSKVLLTSRIANETAIALASWGRLEKLEGYDESQITAFIAANKNKGPERVPD